MEKKSEGLPEAMNKLQLPPAPSLKKAPEGIIQLRACSSDYMLRVWQSVNSIPEPEFEPGRLVVVKGMKYDYRWAKFATDGVPMKTDADAARLFDPKTAKELPRCMTEPLAVGRRARVRGQQAHASQEFIVIQRPWIDPDSNDEHIARISVEALKKEIEMSAALKARAFIIRLRDNSPNLCNIVDEYVRSLKGDDAKYGMKIWALVPVLQPVDSVNHPWNWWVKLRRLTDDNILAAGIVSLCLDVNSEQQQMWVGTYMPYGENNFPFRADIMRWFGEPVSCLRLSKSILRDNRWTAANMQQLNPPLVSACAPEQDDFIRFALGYGDDDINIWVDGDADLTQLDVESQTQAHVLALHYSLFMYQIRYEKESLEVALGGRSSRETMCQPIQPLATNICPTNYVDWETDTVKYDKYREALFKALYHLAYTKDIMEPIVFVLGAGQGPLVIEVLGAAKDVRQALLDTYPPLELAVRFDKFGPRIYAVEKNPRALPKLKERYEKNDWKDEKVEIVETDMRQWQPGMTADLVVSELIGGFGCNELSPECLEHARHLMRPDTICFPSRYDSYVIPIMSTKTMRARREWYLNKGIPPTDQWIVSRCHNRFNVCGTDYRRVFSFSHPHCDDNLDERLYMEKEVAWNDGPLVDCELDGFIGFFTVWLRRKTKDDKSLTFSSYSIVPHLHTENMHAWFPVFFPLQGNRVKVRAGEPIKAKFARRRNEDGSRVWYEWGLLSPQETPVLNEGGRCASMSTVIGQR